MTQASSADILSNLQGQLPADVIQQMQQRAAERGVRTGAAGSPNESAAYLRAIGLTSLDLQNLGQQQLSQAVARTPTGPLFDPSRFYITPADQAQAQLLANIYAAAPNPTAAAQNALALARQGLTAGQGAVGGGGTPVFTGGGAGAPSAGPAFTPQPTVAGSGTGPTATERGYQAWLNALPQRTTAPAAGVQPMYGDLTSASFLNPTAPIGSDAFYPSLGSDFQAGVAMPPDYTGPTLEDLFPGFTVPGQETPPDWQPGVALPDQTVGATAPTDTSWQAGVAPTTTDMGTEAPFSGFLPDTTDYSSLFEDWAVP